MTTSHSSTACSPDLPILDLIQKLASSQSSGQTTEQLAAFLRKEIFTQLGSFSIEFYLKTSHSGEFVPSPLQKQPGNPPQHNFVPESFPAQGKVVLQLQNKNRTLHIQHNDNVWTIFNTLPHSVHLVVPIFTDTSLAAIIYVGASDIPAFSPEYCKAIETLAKVIGSRIKSMATILELQKSIAEEFIKFLNDKKIFSNPVVTEINKLDVFYDAEEDHQEYYDNNTESSYCQFIINPKIKKLKTHFQDKLKQNQNKLT